ARYVELDTIDAFADMRSCHLGHLVRSVGKDGEAVAKLVRAPIVSEAAGDGDLGSTSKQSRSRQLAGLDRVANDDIDTQLGAGRAVGAGEPVIQQQARVAGGEQRMLFGRRVAEI